jgi:drug/metabolite transporter (DMT)-like permease
MRRVSHLDIDNGITTADSAHRVQRSVNNNNNNPLPGRPRRRLAKRSKRSFLYRVRAKWLRPCSTNCSLIAAVGLWYCLGVVSIGSSKILLSDNVPPLFLTWQQLVLGSAMLRSLLKLKCMGSAGLQPWPSAAATTTQTNSRYATNGREKQASVAWLEQFPILVDKNYQPTSLVLAAIYFTLGFLATNYGFSNSSAAFVETIKASEPITSAAVAVLWGIEVLGRQEVACLGVIVAGVLLSTLAGGHDTSASTAWHASVSACLIVMVSNLCFSFRGLYQKLFRASVEGNSHVVDDINLQFRMQQFGVALLSLPMLLGDLPLLARHIWLIVRHKEGLIQSGSLARYVGLALINGLAFTGYNLASTFILTRISVVHHAALNCIRRIFAIIVTSIFFGVPITFVGAIGILCSISGFLGFTHYKIRRQSTPKPLSSLLPISANHNGANENDY